MSKGISQLSVWAALALLAACASARPVLHQEPQRYTGTLRQWFEGQSFTPDGQTQGWFYGINDDAAQKLAAAFPPEFVAPPGGVSIRAEIIGVVTRVSEETRYLSPLTAPWEHYITITDVISAQVIPVGCGDIEFTVYFDSNNYELTPGARDEIDQRLGYVRRNLCNIASIRIIGSADTVGSPQSNLSLSERRAAAVSAIVAAHSFQSDIIQRSGVGETELALLTRDNVAEPLNRNVRIVIVSPPPS